MIAAAPGYSVDTSALIDGIQVYYRLDNFPALWSYIDGLIEAGRFFISEEVAEEVKVKDDDVHAWLLERQDGFVIETDGAVISQVKRILAAYDKLVKEMRNKTRADPFVIAVAQLRSAVVVTGEGAGSSNRPTIPFVCGDLGIDCISLPEIVEREGWTF